MLRKIGEAVICGTIVGGDRDYFRFYVFFGLILRTTTHTVCPERYCILKRPKKWQQIFFWDVVRGLWLVLVMIAQMKSLLFHTV